MPPITVLGLDSASHTGYALLERDGPRERLIGCGVADLSVRPAAAVIEDFMAKVTSLARVDVVAIEDNYLDTDPGKANVATLKTLARLVGRWEQAAESRGLATVLVPAQRWQSGILAGLCGPRADRKSRKAASSLWARATFGVAPVQDACDAIGIAAYEARRRSFAEKVRRVA